MYLEKHVCGVPGDNQPVEMTRSARLLAIVHTVISRILAGHHSVLC